MGKGIFGGLFDFNHDGKMSSFDKAAELGFLHHIMESEKKDTATHTPSYGTCKSLRFHSRPLQQQPANHFSYKLHLCLLPTDT